MTTEKTRLTWAQVKAAAEARTAAGNPLRIATQNWYEAEAAMRIANENWYEADAALICATQALDRAEKAWFVFDNDAEAKALGVYPK